MRSLVLAQGTVKKVGRDSVVSPACLLSPCCAALGINRVSQTSRRAAAAVGSEGSCTTEMTTMMACWRSQDFIDANCQREIRKFLLCLTQQTKVPRRVFGGCARANCG